MNAIGEFDLELLEDYLDDALSPTQVEHVAHRLTEEPELALAMHELRASRLLRSAAWKSLEPAQSHSAELAERVARFVRQDGRRITARRGIWIASGVAAGVALFLVGWLSRASSPKPSEEMTKAALPLARSLGSTVQEAAPYRVALIDRDGRLTPAQKFTKADDARQFARDLLQYEDRRRDAEQGSAMLVSDHF